jgi:hypothetical protein
MNSRITYPKIIISLLIISIVLFLNTGVGFANEGILDGKVFTGSTGKKGKDASETDDLKFANGKMLSTGCTQWGFGWGDYSTKVEGDSITFEAITTSPKNGQIAWRGTVKGDMIDATYVWTKKSWYGERRQEKWLKGKIKEQ